jgi:putative transferase (TIGR04331 family)
VELILSKIKNLLVLTPIVETFGKNEKIFFLGSWCNSSSKRKLFKNRKFLFFKHPYNIDEKKFLIDQKYLNKLRKRLLNSLTVKLNQIHNIAYSKYEWNIIIGHWIKIYTSILFDRWEIIRFFFLKNKFKKMKVFFVKSNHNYFLSNENFVENFNYSDIANHWLFANIIKFLDKKKLKIEFISNYNNKLNHNIFPKGKFNKNIFFYIKQLIDKTLFIFASFILRFNRIIIDGFYSAKVNLKICAKFMIIPFNINSFFNVRNFNILKDDNKRIILNGINFTPHNNFEKFLINNVKNYLPITYVEKFSSLRIKILKYISSKKIIYSQAAYLFNDVYNIWLVEMLKKKSTFFSGDHGGSFIFQNAIINSRKEISKNFISWHKPIDKVDVQLSPLKLIDRSIKLKKNRDRCLIITHELPRYYYLFTDIPVVENNFDELMKIKKMISYFKNEIKLSSIFRNSQNSDWGYEDLIKNSFRNNIKFSTNKNIYDDFKNTKLSICTYPSTPFSESINLNIPSIFFFTKKNWRIHKKFSKLLDDMQNENLFFDDEKLASNHINKIWNNVDDWWNKNSVQNVINQCKKDFFKINKDWLNEYNNFFKKFI